jgi:hypothetical protein
MVIPFSLNSSVVDHHAILLPQCLPQFFVLYIGSSLGSVWLHPANVRHICHGLACLFLIMATPSDMALLLFEKQQQQPSSSSSSSSTDASTGSGTAASGGKSKRLKGAQRKAAQKSK